MQDSRLVSLWEVVDGSSLTFNSNQPWQWSLGDDPEIQNLICLSLGTSQEIQDRHADSNPVFYLIQDDGMCRVGRI